MSVGDVYGLRRTQSMSNFIADADNHVQ